MNPDMTKSCCRCKRVFALDQFDFTNAALGKRRGVCKACIKIESRAYRQNKERKKTQAKKYNDAHRTENQARKKRWRKQNPDKAKAIDRRAYQKHKPRARVRHHIKYYSNPKYRIAMTLRNRLGEAIRESRLRPSTMTMLGCDLDTLLRHLESLWQPGMTWKNYGPYQGDGTTTWHIDHIFPCASFDLTNPEQQKQCFHWSNLQPLWAVDNLRKNGKMPDITAIARAGNKVPDQAAIDHIDKILIKTDSK